VPASDINTVNSDTPTNIYRHAPSIGENTDEILKELRKD
jgi:crotonobetainyl-CoA:carnitine CoA-transferase CaiB-like acyl-CoA transferase